MGRNVDTTAHFFTSDSDAVWKAEWICKSSNMDRDEEIYQVSYVWDKLLLRDFRNRKSMSIC